MNKWLLLSVLGIILMGVSKVAAARGIRNNNPGNIRHGDKWKGMKQNQTDKSFIQFSMPEYGIRAIAIILKNYQSRYGLDTIKKIISRWAPSSENDTESYIRTVSGIVGVGPDEKINVSDNLIDLVKAIIYQENGEQPYSDSTIKKGILMS